MTAKTYRSSANAMFYFRDLHNKSVIAALKSTTYVEDDVLTALVSFNSVETKVRENDEHYTLVTDPTEVEMLDAIMNTREPVTAEYENQIFKSAELCIMRIECAPQYIIAANEEAARKTAEDMIASQHAKPYSTETVYYYYFARVAKLDRPGIINLTLSISKTVRGKYTLAVEGHDCAAYLKEAGLAERLQPLYCSSEKDAKECAKRVAELAKRDGYFQTAGQISTFDMNSLMPYKNRQDVKEVLLYNIEADF